MLEEIQSEKTTHNSMKLFSHCMIKIVCTVVLVTYEHNWEPSKVVECWCERVESAQIGVGAQAWIVDKPWLQTYIRMKLWPAIEIATRRVVHKYRGRRLVLKFWFQQWYSSIVWHWNSMMNIHYKSSVPAQNRQFVKLNILTEKEK